MRESIEGYFEKYQGASMANQNDLLTSSPGMFAGTDNPAVGYGDAIALIARVLLGWLFLVQGWTKLMNPSSMVGYLTNLKVPAPDFWAWPAILGELAIGIALILGFATRYVSLFTVIYLIIATALAHRYWEYPQAQQTNQYNHFLKNIAIMSGALMLYVTGPGRFSLDRWLRKKG
jgi:putative oxidoreductase